MHRSPVRRYTDNFSTGFGMWVLRDEIKMSYDVAEDLLEHGMPSSPPQGCLLEISPVALTLIPRTFSYLDAARLYAVEKRSKQPKRYERRQQRIQELKVPFQAQTTRS